jgi:hypothetical protein
LNVISGEISPPIQNPKFRTSNFSKIQYGKMKATIYRMDQIIEEKRKNAKWAFNISGSAYEVAF